MSILGFFTKALRGDGVLPHTKHHKKARKSKAAKSRRRAKRNGKGRFTKR